MKDDVLLVGPKKAAPMLAVSERTLWNLTFAEQPGLPHVKIGRLTRYSIDDLREWIASRRQGGETR